MRKVLLVLTICLVILPCVNAGLLNSAINDQAQIKGSTSYSYSGSGKTLSGTIDYAVYDRQSTAYSDAFSGALTSQNAGRYIYAYQVFNNVGANNVAVDYLAFGIIDAKVYEITTDGDASMQDSFMNYFTSADGPKSSSTTAKEDCYAAAYNFAGTLGAGETSYFLIFTSDNAWGFVSGDPGAGSGSGSGSTAPAGSYVTVAGGGLGTNSNFDLNVPEPATVAILGFAGLLGLRRRSC